MATVRTHHPLDITESRRPSREIERDEVFPWLLEPVGRASSTAPGRPLSLLSGLHGALVFDRRTWILSERLAALLPASTRILDVGLTPAIWLNKLGLYPTPATWFFDRSLHCVARLDKV